MVSFYVAAARAWQAPTFYWHAAPHQCCNKSIFILIPASPTSSPHPDPFPPHFCTPTWLLFSPLPFTAVVLSSE